MKKKKNWKGITEGYEKTDQRIGRIMKRKSKTNEKGIKKIRGI